MNNNQIARQNSIVTRQTLASWEKGETIPQVKKIEMLKEQGVEVDRFILPAITKFTNLLSKPKRSVTNKEDHNKVCEGEK